MKKAFLVISAIVVIIAVGFFFARSSSDSPKTSPTSTPIELGNETTKTSVTVKEDPKFNEAQTTLGISLPVASDVSMVIKNDLAAGVTGQTSLAIEEARVFFSGEMTKSGYSINRTWGASPVDSAVLKSATFTGNGETWTIILRDESGTTSFDIQRQF